MWEQSGNSEEQRSWVLLWVKLCAPKDVGVLTPSTSSVTLFGNRVFADDQVKIWSLEWSFNIKMSSMMEGGT